MEILPLIAIAAALAWACGVSPYLAMLLFGAFAVGGIVHLPSSLHFLAEPLVIGAAGMMFMIEFVADKIPGFDSIWDAVHSFIRIPAGAALAAAAMGSAGGVFIAPAIGLGALLTAGTHLTKTGTRALINTSPEPFSNWGASFAEDILLVIGMWLAISHPWVFLILLSVFIVVAAWTLPKLWRGIKRVMERLARFFGKPPVTPRLDLDEPTEIEPAD